MRFLLLEFGPAIPLAVGVPHIPETASHKNQERTEKVLRTLFKNIHKHQQNSLYPLSWTAFSAFLHSGKFN
jgi:hypothetical protein